MKFFENEYRKKTNLKDKVTIAQ